MRQDWEYGARETGHAKEYVPHGCHTYVKHVTWLLCPTRCTAQYPSYPSYTLNTVRGRGQARGLRQGVRTPPPSCWPTPAPLSLGRNRSAGSSLPAPHKANNCISAVTIGSVLRHVYGRTRPGTETTAYTYNVGCKLNYMFNAYNHDNQYGTVPRLTVADRGVEDQ